MNEYEKQISNKELIPVVENLLKWLNENVNTKLMIEKCEVECSEYDPGKMFMVRKPITIRSSDGINFVDVCAEITIYAKKSPPPSDEEVEREEEEE